MTAVGEPASTAQVTAVVRSAQLIGDRGARGFAVLRADGEVNCLGPPELWRRLRLEMK